MKIKSLIFISITMLLFISCNSTTEPVIMKDSFAGSSFKTIVVDSCEYIYLNNWFAHKGNCKYCTERAKQSLK